MRDVGEYIKSMEFLKDITLTLAVTVHAENSL